MKEDEMGFLIISEDGAGLGLAVRLQNEGHKVSMTIGDSNTEKLGVGMVEKSKNLELNPTMVSDSSGYGMTLDSYKDQGGRTYSGSQVADRLENDRSFASSVFSECGINEPENESFNSWEEAEEFVREFGDERLVFKPEGEFSGNLPSYVSSGKEDLLAALARFKGTVGEVEPHFVLQEFIEGTCISSEVWVAQGEPIWPTNHTLERKQLMNGDIGPSGGCTGNVVWRCDDKDCKLCNNLMLLEPFLQRHKWNGPIDINTVVDKDGKDYALEFTPRFGYDAFPAFLLGLFDGDFGSFINDSCRGDAGIQPLREGFAAGIRISIPPWPTEGVHAKSGVELRGLREIDLNWSGRGFYPYEVGLVKDSLVTSGGRGALGVCVGHGKEIENAFEDAYEIIKRLKIPDLQYRTDLHEVFKHDIYMLRRAYSKDFARS